MTRRNLWWLCCLWMAMPAWGIQDEAPAVDAPAAAVQQEGQMVIAAASDDGGEVQMSAITFSSDGDGANVFSFAAPVAGMAFGSSMGDMSQFLVNDPDVQSEIEATDEQLEQIRQMNNEFGKEMKSKIDATMRGPDANRGDLGAVISEIQRRQSERLGEILVPHQLDRLKQISFQRNEKFAGASGALLGKEIAEKLGIDDEQKEKIKTRAAELKKEFDAKVEELKEKMRTELLDELTGEQREQLAELRGETFEFKEPEMPRLRKSGRRARIEPGNQDN